MIQQVINYKKKVHDNVTTATTTTYIGGFRYENDDLKEFSREKGRIRRKPPPCIYIASLITTIKEGSFRRSHKTLLAEQMLPPRNTVLPGRYCGRKKPESMPPHKS